jgi:hypothetical protein
MHGPRPNPNIRHSLTDHLSGHPRTAYTQPPHPIITLQVLLDSRRLLSALDARGISLDLIGLTGELVHESRGSLERSSEVALGLLAVKVEFGGFRPGSQVNQHGRFSRSIKERRRQGRYDSLKDSLEGHDGLDKQGLSVLHVDVEETHKGNSLRFKNNPSALYSWLRTRYPSNLTTSQ